MISQAIKTALAAALAASAAVSVPALATEQGETVAVRYTNLDLASPQGQSALMRRLERAAEQVCGIDRRREGAALPSGDARRCYRETMRTVEREVALRTVEQQRG